MDKIQFLFYFSSEDLCLIETKRTDLPSQAPLSEIYKWLIYSKAAKEFVTLSFRNMIKGDTNESRSFAEAELEFDGNQAELNYQGRVFKLIVENPQQISPNLKAETEKYLLGLV
jgi:hypothetical protein